MNTIIGLKWLRYDRGTPGAEETKRGTSEERKEVLIHKYVEILANTSADEDI